jgi:hypothetical protein
MKSIAFTDKQEHVFTRFNALRRAYEDANGGARIYNPDFLTVLMDRFNTLENIQAFAKTLGEADQLRGKAFVLIPFWDENRIDICTPSYRVESSPDQWDVVGSFSIDKSKNGECSGFCGLNYCDENGCVESKPISLRAYIADAEASDPNLQPVRLKDGDNRYINKATTATTNLFLSDDRIEAMVFDSPDQAKAFLRKCGHAVGNWIFEPVNESK